MKTFKFLTIVAVLFASCSKKDDNNKEPETDTVILQKMGHAQGTAVWATEYFFDTKGIATQYKVTGANGNFTATLQRNASGKISRVDFSQGRTGYTVVEYGVSGRISKVFHYRDDGLLNSEDTYSYTADGHQISYATPNSTLSKYAGKEEYVYTADKKNVAVQKRYNSVDVLTTEQVFTYTDKPNPYNIYPANEIHMISGSLPSKNAVSKENIINHFSSTTYTRNYTHTDDRDGYITASEAVYTNGTAPLNSSFSYLVK